MLPVADTRPSSGSSLPVRMRSRVVLPPPLRPTTPIRSPALTPRDTPSSTVVVAYALLTFSNDTSGAVMVLPFVRLRARSAPRAVTGPYHRGQPCDAHSPVASRCTLLVRHDAGTGDRAACDPDR